MSTDCYDIVLAAGAGTRMGSPKGLVPLAGVPLVVRVLREVRASQLTGALVVVGAEQARVSDLAKGDRTTVIANPEWMLGQSSSVKAGVEALPSSVGAFLIHPVDHAMVKASDLDALWRAWRGSDRRSDAIFRPIHGDRAGHPVLFGSAYRDAFLRLSPDQPANVVYRSHRERVGWVPVDHPGVTWDLDTPEQLREAEIAWSRDSGRVGSTNPEVSKPHGQNHPS